MKLPIAVPLLLLAVSSFVGATKEVMKIRKNGVQFKVIWWDDGRYVPYRIFFRKYGIGTHHKFTSDGHLSSLTIDSTTYVFTWGSSSTGEDSPTVEVVNPENRMLVGQEEKGVENVDEDVILDRRRLYDCGDCESTFKMMCGQGLEDVCYWVPNIPDWFTDEHVFAMETVCTKFGKACEAFPEDACEDYCGDGEIVQAYVYMG